MGYDPRELENVLRARGVQSECPSCRDDHPDWGVRPVLLLEDNVEHEVGGKGFPYLALVCGNCGFTRLYHANVLGLKQLRPRDPD